jgi:hypothetical protein
MVRINAVLDEELPSAGIQGLTNCSVYLSAKFKLILATQAQDKKNSGEWKLHVCSWWPAG